MNEEKGVHLMFGEKYFSALKDIYNDLTMTRKVVLWYMGKYYLLFVTAKWSAAVLV